MSEPMLTIHNRHSTACGIPPSFGTEAATLYIGCFENRHGEQWVFTCNRATREASRGGDVGWDRAHPVRDGRVEGLILAPEEAEWLQACWSSTAPLAVTCAIIASSRWAAASCPRLSARTRVAISAAS